MKKYTQLLRIKQYIKNGLIFVPAFFEGTFLKKENTIKLTAGFVAFCLVCSAVYIMNDIKDAQKDRAHPVKCRRPIASGRVSPSVAAVIAAVCSVSGYMLLALSQNSWIGRPHIYMLIYAALNIGYSFGLKNVPLVDIAILASGFLLRLFYGAALCETWVSNWLYLTILMGSLYMGIGKRKKERMHENSDSARAVLKFYSVVYLDKIMQISIILAIMFYSLWSAGTAYAIWTVPLVLLIVMRYEMALENNEFGDPTDIILSDRALQVMMTVYGMIELGLLYR